MVFLIQSNQNRYTAAIQPKLDELIRANENARNRMLCLEDLTEDELKRVKASFATLAEPAQQAVEAVRDAQGDLRETEYASEQVTVEPSPTEEQAVADDRSKRGAANRDRRKTTRSVTGRRNGR